MSNCVVPVSTPKGKGKSGIAGIYYQDDIITEPFEYSDGDVIVEKEYRTPTTEHAFLEPECAIGIPAGFMGHDKLTIYVGSQIPYQDRNQIAGALGLPDEAIRVRGTLIGGGFGGKEDIAGQIHVALLAQVTGLPS